MKKTKKIKKLKKKIQKLKSENQILNNDIELMLFKYNELQKQLKNIANHLLLIN